MASGKTPGLTQEANGVAIDRQNNTDVFDDMIVFQIRQECRRE